MFIKPLILALLAACGAPASNPATSESPTEQPDRQQPDDPEENQHFCCRSVDPKSVSGEGCLTIAATQIDQCAEVLYCQGSWTKHDGTVTCT